MQSTLFAKSVVNPNDVVFTPEPLAKIVVDTFAPTGRCLDPCRGHGAFFKYLPAGSDWCEITEGRDFFDYHRRVDWIISNPPHSIFNQWLLHSFEIAENVVYLVPFSKVFKSWGTLTTIAAYGGIVRIVGMPSSRAAGFPFGYPMGIFHFQRNYKGLTSIEIER